MRIIIVNDHAHVNGGQAKVAIESALGLRARGHAVTFFAAVGPVDPRLEEAGLDVVLLDQDDITTAPNRFAFAAQFLWNGRAARTLAALLASCRPEDTIVHLHGFAKSLSAALGPAIAQSGVPAVHTLHDFFLVCPNGGFYDYPAAAICHRRPMSPSCMTRNCDARSYPRKVLRLARHAAMSLPGGLRGALPHVVAISDLQESVAAPYLPAGTTIHRVDNPIAVSDPGPKPAGAPLGEAIFVGRLSAEKGAPVFAEAARRAGVRPVFVGAGPSEARLRADYPQADFAGWQPAAEVQRRLRAARALVFPSIWYEGQPLTVYEALALGTPVIVSDACAGREAVRDGETGLWFRSGAPDDLARALRVVADDATATRMSAAAHARYWAAPLSLDRHLDALLAVYATVMAAHRARSTRGAPAAAVSAALSQADAKHMAAGPR